MKKILCAIFMWSYLCHFGFCYEPIVDNFALKTLDKNLKVQKAKTEPIVDEFALKTLDKDLKVRKVKIEPIVDEFALSTLNPDLKIKKIKRIYDFENINIEFIKVSPLELISTKRAFEGQRVNFVIAEDTIITKEGRKIKVKRGMPLSARVELISPNQARGVPADIILGNFMLDNKIPLEGQIKATGANRSLWVYPASYLLSVFFFTGLFIYPIRGGHAKIKPKNIYKLEI